MLSRFYIFIVALSKLCGVWVFIVVSKAISAGYFLFFPKRVQVSTRFYRALFPNKSRLYHLWCTWRQYQGFTKVFLDRFMLLDFNKITYNSEGWEYLEELTSQKTGGIILMSHKGNWEVAAHLLKRKQGNIDLLLYLGTKHKEQIEKMQKDSLVDSRIKVIAVDQNGGSPFHLIEGNRFMNDGGMVSLTGDMVWNESQRTVPVAFLGHEVLLPESPHLLALLSQKPLFVLFSFRTGKNHYSIKICPPIYVGPASRAGRKDAVKQSAQEYANLMEQVLRKHPCEWFHFEPFLGRKL
ncbi:MAG: lysophospholipid acyltransferase family protein [Proteobacteria bacterium]|nr:lysophospholipid acyltransferase family protein [Pseudomonadota bacterium]